jgi:hypothetical protein
MPTMVRQERKVEMRRAAYFMARFRESGGKYGSPPNWMGVSSWTDAERRLFKKLSDGRDRVRFCGSIREDRQYYVRCMEKWPAIVTR